MATAETPGVAGPEPKGREGAMGGMVFVDYSKPPKKDAQGPGTADTGMESAPEAAQATIPDAYPSPLLNGIKDENRTAFLIWMDQWLMELISGWGPLLDKWAQQEEAYRALPGGPTDTPYVGACRDTIPAIAMAVDPILARLSGGIFKADPIFATKALRKQWVGITDSLERWIQFYMKHKMKLRDLVAPHLFEFVKHGHMVLKTVYDREEFDVQTYDKMWKVVKRHVTRFKGPRVSGVQINNFIFPPLYQHLQLVPICAERQILTWDELSIAAASGKLSREAVNSLKGKEMIMRDQLELRRELSSDHQEVTQQRKFYFEIWEIHCNYDIDGDGIPEKLIITYHRHTRTVLQLRYNWYFNQRYPYTVIPYTVTNNSILGLGICEMMKPFQDTITNWHRMATDNAYLANIRMFIARTDAKIETRPKLFSGRVFRVDDPQKDFIPFAAADIYNSTTSERQNLFGMGEKRTGVSDYLTGRESPILGSRATATSTVALIQEGTKRVEEVLENIRSGMAEVLDNCMAIWVQYGLDGVDDIAFGDDQVAADIKEFFNSVGADNVQGSLGIELTAADVSNTKTAQQQMQLAIIQVLMGYYEKLVSVGQMAVQAQQQMPQLADMLEEIMTAARKMFMDLLQKYDIRNPEAYLPDLEKIIAAGQQAGPNGMGPAGPGAPPGQSPAPGGQPGLPALPPRPPVGPVPSAPGSGT